ncbi:TPA: hypothetical protein ACH3X1_015652 [Trebouxia sp. C0004]
MLLQHQAQGCRLAIWRPHCFHNLSRPQSCHVRASSSRPTARRHPFIPNRCCGHDLLSKRKQARCTKSSGVTCQAEQPKATKLSMDVGGRQMTLETGEIGRQANGAVNLTYGDTVLYTTACCSLEATGDGSFIPLQVNYTERFSAAGKTSGGFIKRDGRSRESEVLVSRLTDRPIRPMFETGWNRETQLLTWVLSYDGEQSPEPLAITAAGAALAVSDIPLKKAVAGVRVGLLPELGFVVNPTVQQMEESKLDLIMAGTDSAVLMIEGYCDFLTEDQMLEVVRAILSNLSSMWRQRVIQLQAR